MIKILVIGEECDDVFIYGKIDRLSPEAPVPVFQPIKTKTNHGMSGNVVDNLLSLSDNISITHWKQSDKITKTRLVESKSNHMIVRIDEGESNPVESLGDLTDEMINIIKEQDIVIISDYNKGLVTYDLVKSIRKKYSGPIFIDTKKHDLKEFEGCVVKINETEFSKANSTTSSLIVTQGNKGCTYNGVQFPVRETEVVDVTGCGDTFLAALVFMFLETNDIVKAIEFANKAASVTVQHLGVYAPKLEEIK